MPKTVPNRPISSQTLIFSQKTPLFYPPNRPKCVPKPSQTVPFVPSRSYVLSLYTFHTFLTFIPSHVPTLPHLPYDAAPLMTPSTAPDAEFREACALELFRRGKLSHYELSKLLGLDRFETDALLKRHNVVEGSLTMDDLDEQGETLDRVLGPVRH